MACGDFVLIGVDGGATEVKAHAVVCQDIAQWASFDLGSESAARINQRVPAFTPLPVAEQLAQRDAGDLRISPEESEQGRLFVAAAVEAVVDIARQSAARRVLVGAGMPGLKTADGRGICVINNGPRIPDYLDQLESGIAAAGVELVSPIAALGSDADYCGLGEEYSVVGLFTDVDSAYYVGCGTGIADAMKLRGKLVPFDEARSWIQKSWQIPSALGPTFEKLVSAKSINRIYADLRVASMKKPAQAPPADAGFPEADAADGRPIAIAWLNTAALVLAELIFERLWTIKHGRAEATFRGGSYLGLVSDHAFRGTLLDRVVIGQRLGLIYADPTYRPIFSRVLDRYLVELITASNDADMAGAYLSPLGDQLRLGFMQPSKLRAAPALGAAIAAARALRARRA